MNDKLELLYNSYIENGLLSPKTTFEQFSQADQGIIDNLYKKGVDNKIVSSQTDYDTFKGAWSSVKKKDSSEVISEDQPLVSEQEVGTSDASGVTEDINEYIVPTPVPQAKEVDGINVMEFEPPNLGDQEQIRLQEKKTAARHIPNPSLVKANRIKKEQETAMMLERASGVEPLDDNSIISETRAALPGSDVNKAKAEKKALEAEKKALEESEALDLAEYLISKMGLKISPSELVKDKERMKRLSIVNKKAKDDPYDQVDIYEGLSEYDIPSTKESAEFLGREWDPNAVVERDAEIEKRRKKKERIFELRDAYASEKINELGEEIKETDYLKELLEVDGDEELAKKNLKDGLNEIGNLFLTDTERSIKKLQTEIDELEAYKNDGGKWNEKQSNAYIEKVRSIQAFKKERELGTSQLFDPLTGTFIQNERADKATVDFNKTLNEELLKYEDSGRGDLEKRRNELYYMLKTEVMEILLRQQPKDRNPLNVRRDGDGNVIPMTKKEILDQSEIYSKSFPFSYGALITGGSRNSGDFSNWINVLNSPHLYTDEQKADANELYARFLGVNRALNLNEDPGTLREGDFIEGVVEAFDKTLDGTKGEKFDKAEVFMTEMKSMGIPLTEQQEREMGQSFSKSLGSTVAESAILMVDIAAGSYLLGGTGSALRIPARIRKLSKTLGGGNKAMQFGYNLALQSAAYEMAGQSAFSGAGEYAAESSAGAALEKLGSKNAMVNFILKLAAGTGGETIAEYTGGFAENFAKSGDIQIAAEDTFGKTVEEREEIFWLTFTTSLMFSSVGLTSREIANSKRNARNMLIESGSQSPIVLEGIEILTKELEAAEEQKTSLTQKKNEAVSAVQNALAEAKKSGGEAMVDGKVVTEATIKEIEDAYESKVSELEIVDINEYRRTSKDEKNPEVKKLKEQIEGLRDEDGLIPQDKKTELDRLNKAIAEVEAQPTSKVEAKEADVEEKSNLEITPENSSNYANMTEDGEGNFVFYHKGAKDYETIKPSSSSDATSKAEAAATRKVGGVSMYYTSESDGEAVTSGREAKYMVRVPKEKVYDANTDNLGLAKEAKERHAAEYPGQGYDANTEMAYMTKIAAEKGFDMIVGEWDGKTRAQTTKEMTPSDVMLIDGNTVTQKFKEKFEDNKKKGYESFIPETKTTALDAFYKKLNKERNKEGTYDDIYRLTNEASSKSQEQISKEIEESDISQELKDEYKAILDKKYDKRRSKKKIVASPKGKLFNEPNPETKKISERYKEKKGIEDDGGSNITSVDEANAKEIADAYENMEDTPNDPKVQEAYKALADETLSQYEEIVAAGYEVEIYEGDGEPYANSAEMLKDLKENKHLYIFSTETGFGDAAITDKQRSQNAMLQDSKMKDKNGKPLLYNDVFRFVHDFFGHSERGNGFGAIGEENAWDVHSRMYSPLARRAMTTETRGQNSWVNFGKQVRNNKGEVIKKGEKGYLAPKDRAFAPQKMGLLPEKFSDISEKVSPKTTTQKRGESLAAEFKEMEASKKDTSKIEEQVENAKKAIAKVSPKTKIVVHKTAKDYKNSGKNRKQNEGGEYDIEKDTIHINLESANERTIAHEVFHALLLNKGMNDKQAKSVTDNMLKAVKKTASPELLSRLEEFSGRYESALQSEESIAELFGILAAGYPTLPKPTQNIIKRWLDKLAKLFGLKMFTDNEVVDMLNVVSKKVKEGIEISEKELKPIRKKVDLEKEFEGGIPVDELTDEDLDQDAPSQWKGGKSIDNPSDGISRKQVGDFDVQYTEQNRLDELLKEGLITQPKDVSQFEGQMTTITSPDDMLAGSISIGGDIIFEGGGGVFFVTKYGDVWASGKIGTANNIANSINKSLKKNGGNGYLTLTKGSDTKLISSASGVNSSMAVLGSMIDKGLISAYDFRKAVSASIKKNGGQIRLTGDALALKEQVDEYFSDPKTTTFQRRGDVMRDILGALSQSQSIKNNNDAIVSMLGGNPDKKIAKKDGIKSQGLTELVAGVASEQLTKGLSIGDVYAVIEVNSEVEVVEDSHPSYPFHIRVKDGSKPVLHLLQNRENGRETLKTSTGKEYKVGNVSVLTGSFNESRSRKQLPADTQRSRKQIVGENAELSDNVRDNLSVAREMGTANKDTKTIRIATGWEKGADGKWRYEIDDVLIKDDFSYKDLKRIPSGLYSGKLSDVINNEKLFDSYSTRFTQEVDILNDDGSVEDFKRTDNYPPISDIKVYFEEVRGGTEVLAEYDPFFKTITINIQPGNSTNKQISTGLLHEIQHYIQGREGFARGGDSRMFDNEMDTLSFGNVNALRSFAKDVAIKNPEKGWDITYGSDAVKKYEEIFGEKPSPTVVTLASVLEQQLSRGIDVDETTVYKTLKNNNLTSFEKYKRLAGEVESRNVEKRKGMTPEQRRETTLQETEDVAREDQIFFTEETTTKSRKQLPADTQRSRKQRTTRLAPNGKRSNLTDVQYDAVRTPAFKKWFGDWQNDPKNASKVVDENGEPRVMYHGTNANNIEEFDRNKSERTSSRLKEFGTYFGSNKKLSDMYAEISKPNEAKVKSVEKRIAKLKSERETVRNNRDFDRISEEIKSLEKANGRVYEVFLNLRNVQEFDAEGGMGVNAWNKLEVKASYTWATNRKAMEFLMEGTFGVDKKEGVIAKNIADGSFQTQELIDEHLGDVVLVFDTTKKTVKLADGSNTTFDPESNNIRKQLPADDLTKIEAVRKLAQERGYTEAELKAALEALGFSKEEINSTKEKSIADAQEKFDTSIKRGNTKADAVKSALGDLESTTWYRITTDTKRDAAVKELKESLGEKIKKAPSTKKVLGVKKKKVTVDEMAALKSQIKLEAKAARESVKAYKDASKKIITYIKQLQKTGVITKAQSSSMIKKVLSTNMLNDKMVSRLEAYISKIYTKAELAEKISRARKLRKTAINNIKSKVGPSRDLLQTLRDLFSVDPSLIPLNKIDAYLDILTQFGERSAVLKLKEAGEVMDSASDILSSIEEVDKVDLDKVSLPNKLNEEIEADLDGYLKGIISNKIEFENVQEGDAKDLAMFLNSLTSSDLELLIKEKKDGTKDYSMLEKLREVKSNITNGYVPALANSIRNTVKAKRSESKIRGVVEKTKKYNILTGFSRVYGKVKGAITGKTGLTEAIRGTMTTAIDDILGNFNSKTIYNNVILPLAQAFSAYQADMSKNVDAKLDLADSLLYKTKIPSIQRLTNAVQKSKYKIQAYRLQREFESNPDSKQVATAVDFIDATIEAISFNEAGRRLNQRDIKILKEIKKEFSEGGQISLSKIEDSLSKNEKKALKLIDEAADMEAKALWTATVIRGVGMKPINNYVHHNIIPKNDTAESDNVLKGSNKMSKPSTNAGTLRERTPGAKAINFDPISSTSSGARETLLDYHMTDAVKVVNAAVKGVKYTGDLTKDQQDAINAIDNIKNELLDNVFKAQFVSETSFGGALKGIQKLGYAAALASVPRAGAELGSNLTYAFTQPQAFLGGIKNFGGLVLGAEGMNAMDNLGSTETMRLYDTDVMTSKMVDSNILHTSAPKAKKTAHSIVDKASFIYQMGPKQLKALTTFVADKLISTPDKAVSRPFWFGAFALSFKKSTGISLTKKDMQEVADGTSKYLSEEYKDAREKATKYADQEVIKMASSNNPFNTVLKNVVSPNDAGYTKIYKAANSYMSTFMMNEYATARNAVLSLFKQGDLSKAQSVATLSGLIIRMGSYMVLYSVLRSAFDSLFGYEDEDEEELSDLALRQFIGAPITLITGRGLGQIPRLLVNFGVEQVNENYLEGLRDGKDYDPYKHSLVFSQVSEDNLKNKTPEENLIKMFAGPYSPLLSSGSRLVKVVTRSITSKTEETKDKYKKELEDRMTIEAMGNLGFLPFYKDIRRMILKDLFKGYNEPKKKKKKYNWRISG